MLLRPRGVQEKLAKEAWGAALQRAKGEKVFDDPRLLKKSLKKVRIARQRTRWRGRLSPPHWQAAWEALTAPLAGDAIGAV